MNLFYINTKYIFKYIYVCDLYIYMCVWDLYKIPLNEHWKIYLISSYDNINQNST